MGRERASATLDNPRRFGARLGAVLDTALGPHGALSLREAARRAGLSAPALAAIVAGRRRRLSMRSIEGIASLLDWLKQSRYEAYRRNRNPVAVRGVARHRGEMNRTLLAFRDQELRVRAFGGYAPARERAERDRLSTLVRSSMEEYRDALAEEVRGLEARKRFAEAMRAMGTELSEGVALPSLTGILGAARRR